MHHNFLSTQPSINPFNCGGTVPVRELHAGHRAAILKHFLQLSDDDRHLRFGTQTPNEVIEHYVEGLDFIQDTIFGIFDADLNIVGLAHLAYLPGFNHEKRAAEFGVSVLVEGRAKGLGTALLNRAAVHARNTRIETLFVHCLANNKAMMHLAKKAGMKVEFAYGDVDAYLSLPPSNPSTIVEEAANLQWAEFDYALKENIKRSNEAWWWFLGKPSLGS